MVNFVTFWVKKLSIFKKQVLNDLKICFAYSSFFFAIFGYILFHQIVFKTSKSFFLLWFLYHRLDLRWFQGCPTFTFCLGCTQKAKKANFRTCPKAGTATLISIPPQLYFQYPKSSSYTVTIGKSWGRNMSYTVYIIQYTVYSTRNTRQH